VLFKPVGNWGGPNSDQLAVLGRQQGQELAAGLREQWSAARGGPSRRPQTEETPYVCYAARPNSLVVRADGHVGKCTVMLQDKRNRIGTLREDGRLELEAGRLAPWMRGFRSFDAGALSCPAVGLPKQEELLTTGAA
jgi:uncharacterized protein